MSGSIHLNASEITGHLDCRCSTSNTTAALWLQSSDRQEGGEYVPQTPHYSKYRLGSY